MADNVYGGGSDKSIPTSEKQPTRTPYEPPQLRYLGSVRKLTLASKRGGFVDVFAGGKATRG